MPIWIAFRQDYVGSTDIIGAFHDEFEAIDACEYGCDFVIKVETGKKYLRDHDGLRCYPVANAKIAVDSLVNDWLDGYVPREI